MLNNYLKSHARSFPFDCDICKATFSQRRQLVTHSKSIHRGHVVEEAAGFPLSGGVHPDGGEGGLNELQKVEGRTNWASLENGLD